MALPHSRQVSMSESGKLGTRRARNARRLTTPISSHSLVEQTLTMLEDSILTLI
jgi:hypothetical protein